MAARGRVRIFRLFRWRDPLPEDLEPAWRAFLHCAERVEEGRRALISTLPTGRVEPAPVGVGLDAVESALVEAGAHMGTWRVPELAGPWRDCVRALEEARSALGEAREVAATTAELEELLAAVEEVVAPLEAFADAERAWRRTWRVPGRPPD